MAERGAETAKVTGTDGSRRQAAADLVADLAAARAVVLAAPGRWPALARLLDATKRAGRFAEAGRPVAWGLVLAPGDRLALRIAALHHRAAGDHAASVATFRALVERHPHDVAALSGLAASLRRLGDGDASLSAHVRAAALPAWPDDQLPELCRWLDGAGRAADATQAARRRVLLRPDIGALAAVLAGRLRGSPDPDAAQRLYRRALVLDPADRAAAFSWCAHLAVERGDPGGPARLAETTDLWRHAVDILELFRTFAAIRERGLDDVLVRRLRALGHLDAFVPGVSAMSTAAEVAAAVAALGGGPLGPPTGFVSDPAPPLGPGVVVAASCDRVYFERYAASLLAASAQVGGVAAVHFHLVDGPADRTTVDGVAGPPMVLSHECYAGDGLAAYAAVARFLVAPALLRRYRRDLLVIDCDAVPGIDPRRVSDFLDERNADAGLTLRDRLVPWHAALASLSAFRPSDRGLAFADGLGAVVRAAIARNPAWMTDQASLVCWRAHVERHRLGFRVANLAEHPEFERLHETIAGRGKWYRPPVGAGGTAGAAGLGDGDGAS